MEKGQKKQFIITKKVAKHGNQAIVVIPKVLKSHLKPGTIAQFTIDILSQPENDTEVKNDQTII